MASATSTIHVPGVDRRELASLRSRARAKGLSVENYVKELIDTDLHLGELARSMTIDELLAPVRKQFEASGMTEEDLDLIVDKARRQHNKRIRKDKKR